MVILVLSPHTDDGEFGCGGTMARLIEEQNIVFHVAFSSAEESLPKGMPPGTLVREIKKASSIIGLLPERLLIRSFAVRKFPEYRQEILEELIRLKKRVKPSLVILPSTTDTHQDHQTISQEGFRAFKNISMLGYEMPHNNLNFTTNMFVKINERHLRRKIEALQCYDSQKERIYSGEQYIRSLARVRGTQMGTEYAEVFEVIRWVI